VIIRNRTLSQYIGYDLYLKFSFVFEKSVTKAFLFYQAKPSFHLELIQKYKPQRISSRRKKVSGFIIDDEIQIKVGSELINLALDCY